MLNESLMSSDRPDWNTPANVIELVRAVGPIGLDPCSNPQSIVCARVSLSLEDGNDGLAENWIGIIRNLEADRWLAEVRSVIDGPHRFLAQATKCGNTPDGETHSLRGKRQGRLPEAGARVRLDEKKPQDPSLGGDRLCRNASLCGGGGSAPERGQAGQSGGESRVGNAAAEHRRSGADGKNETRLQSSTHLDPRRGGEGDSIVNRAAVGDGEADECVQVNDLRHPIGPASSIVFVNCPYGREIGPWIEKCRSEADYGAEIIALVPARTDAKWFQPLWTANAICFVRGRLRFGGASSGAPFPSAIPYFGRRAEKFARVFGELGRVVRP